ncbi:GNAT family N-acetyltransferase [Pseudobacteriovorax antillogorgiicola]|uniref:GNAT family N-acetyltransferase n=1 Tax=Pseudobacteriovorax antillogorgiicola TaxID=1513793 RepID=UPI001F172F8D|nr:GNAT family N-acetyltransferase [Pseudobacteriovorax antillogorgiicola]
MEWDSDFFSFGVAKLKPTSEGGFDIKKALQQRSIKLAYIESHQLLPQLENFLIGGKVKYSATLPLKKNSICKDIVSISPSESSEELESLAIQSGQFSRFNRDPNIAREKFEELYRCWITRSIRREIAFENLASKSDDKIRGMITLAKHGDRGRIGLIAVDHKYRGHGIGKMLIEGAAQKFTEENLKYVDVYTQCENVGACKLYNSCGFKVIEKYYIYHIWVN